MKKFTIVAATAVTGAALAAVVASPAYAWHPEGKIVKYVTNVTANGTMQDANTAADAVAAKPGDILKYTIVVSNPAAYAHEHQNDLADVVLKDSLPAGVELVSDPDQREITEDLGTILPGKDVTKEYTVKVTATEDGVIENEACFTGNSVVKDAPREGCDTANVDVTVPAVLPAATETPEAPAELPKTGPANILVLAGIIAAAGYLGNLLRLRFARNS